MESNQIKTLKATINNLNELIVLFKESPYCLEFAKESLEEFQDILDDLTYEFFCNHCEKYTHTQYEAHPVDGPRFGWCSEECAGSAYDEQIATAFRNEHSA